MKRILYFLVLFVALDACQKHEIASDQEKSTNELITLTASIDLSNTKVIPVDPTADTVYFKWQPGDSIFVCDIAFTTYEVFKIVDNSISPDGMTASFTGKPLSDMSLYAVLTGYSGADANQLCYGPYNTKYVEGSFNLMGMGGGMGNYFMIYVFQPVLKLRLKGNATIGKIEYYYLAGEEEWEPKGYRLSNTLMCKDGIALSSDTTSVYIAAPQRSNYAFKLVFYDTDGNVLKIQESTKNIKEVISVITCPVLEVNAIPEGALGGLFSVSADKKVRFSKGNLQYQASTGTWQFAPNQYSYIGKAAGNNVADETTRSTQSDWIDLFGWGTTGQNEYGQQPYSISTENSDYKTIENASSDETLTIANKSDWGYCMGGTTSVWRTLSGGDNGEWKYLLSTRSVNGGTGEGKSYQRATINSDATGVYGIIVYPDNYTTQKTGEEAKSYTSAQWTAMESAGCVFLPAAGYRSGSDVNGAGEYGYYWSSTAYSSNTISAYDMDFSKYSVTPYYDYSRSFSVSVRLVSDVQ